MSKNEKTIAFHLNHLGLRGTDVSTYDYALNNIKILNNKSIIVVPRKKVFNKLERVYIDFLKKIKIFNNNNIVIFKKKNRASYKKFSKKFKIFFYDHHSEINDICKNNNVDYFYAQKYGNNDHIISSVCFNLIHVVFMANEPHGDKYLYISKWLSKKMTGDENNFVPYMIDFPKFKDQPQLRKKLNIPDKSIVFGRYGGINDFDINFVKETIIKINQKRKDIYFLFMNTKKFTNHQNSIFLKGTFDLKFKSSFVDASDAMIHGRERGETFGLAVGEFSSRNKPIFTYEKSKEKAHLDILENKVFKYKSGTDLFDLINNFKKNENNEKNYDCYSQNYSPKKVMKIFEERFLL